jgi:hypothetical protein
LNVNHLGYISTSQIGWIFVYCFLMKTLSGGNKKEDLNLIGFYFFLQGV